MSDVPPNPDDVFDIERIRRLVELMEQHDLREVDLRQNEQRIRLNRGVEQNLAAFAGPNSMSPATPIAAVVTTPEPEGDGEHVVTISSPMVGTFYSKANPEAASFVKVGDRVDKETVVCIIEAMKVFNEIPADVTGKIVAVFVENEEPVEFGRPLFKVDTSQ